MQKITNEGSKKEGNHISIGNSEPGTGIILYVPYDVDEDGENVYYEGHITFSSLPFYHNTELEFL